MQWYLDWVGNTWTPVPDWDLVQFMTVGPPAKPGGEGTSTVLFLNNAARGHVRDPQTAHEYWSPAARMSCLRGSGRRELDRQFVQAVPRLPGCRRRAAVQQRRARPFQRRVVVGVIEGPYSEPFQIWGDNTMIRGGDGYRFANEAAQLSQRSILDILAKGSTTHTVQEISGHFPTKVHDNAQNRNASRSLQDWAYGLKGQANGWFDGLKNRVVGSFRMRLEPINIDKVGGWEWQQVGGKARDVAVGGDGSVWVHRPVRLSGGERRRPLLGYGDVHMEAPEGRGSRRAHRRRWRRRRVGRELRRPYLLRRPHQDSSMGEWRGLDLRRRDGLTDIAAGSDGSVWGLAKAKVSGATSWCGASAAAARTAGKHRRRRHKLSVGPDGLPWLVNSGGALMRLVPSKAADRYQGVGVGWPNITPPGARQRTSASAPVG